MSAEHAFAFPEDTDDGSVGVEAEASFGSGVVRVSRRVFEAPTVRPPVGFVAPIAPSLPASLEAVVSEVAPTVVPAPSPRAAQPITFGARPGVPSDAASRWSTRTMPAMAPTAVATMKISWADVRDLAITHTDAFFLSLVDGASTVETLVDVCGMPPVVAYTTLARLIGLGIVQLDG